MGLFQLTFVILLAFLLLYSLLPLLFAYILNGSILYKKAKIFLLTFALPVSIYLVIFYQLFAKNIFLNIAIISILVLMNVVGLIVSSKKYLTKFILDTTTLTLEYLTPLFKVKTLQLDVDEVEEFEIIRRNWLVDYPSSLKIKHSSGWLAFEFIDNKLKQSVKNQITVANERIAQGEITVDKSEESLT